MANTELGAQGPIQNWERSAEQGVQGPGQSGSDDERANNTTSFQSSQVEQFEKWTSCVLVQGL